MPKPRDVLRVGQISSTNTDTGSCRATHDDLQDKDGKPYVSNDLQTVFPAMGKWMMFFTPRKGDHVATLHLPNGNQEGFILGTYYTAGHLPKDGDEGVVQLISEDGESVIRLNADGTVSVKMKESISVETKTDEKKAETISQEASDKYTVKAESINQEASGGYTVKVGSVTEEALQEFIIRAGTVTIEASGIELIGDVTIKGDLTVKGNIINMDADDEQDT